MQDTVRAAAVSAIGISKAWRCRALHDVTLSIPAETGHDLLRPSGSGKTTCS